MEFVHLHTHSHFSLYDGIPGIKALVKTAATNSMKSLALTDHNSLAGVIPFINECKNYGVKPIIGAELTVGSFNRPKTASMQGQFFYTTLLVKNELGYKNLVKLITTARSNGNEKPYVDFETFINNTKGLIVLIGGIKSEFFSLLALNKISDIENYIYQMMTNINKEDLYFELQDHNQKIHKIVIEKIIDLAEFLNIKTVGTNNVHYLHPEDHIAYQFLINKDLAEIRIERRGDAKYTMHFATIEEMYKKFSYNHKILQNTLEVAEKCNFNFDFNKKRFPSHDFLRGEDAPSALWNLVFENSNQIYSPISSSIKERLNTEFDYIRERNFANYFLLLYKISQFLKEKGITKGPGKGNVVTSIISYVLGITDIDPIEYHLKFQGMGLNKDALPMTSIEIPTDYIDEIVNYLRDSYGKSNICEVSKYKFYHKGVLFKKICQWAEVPPSKVSALLNNAQKSRTPIALTDTNDETARNFNINDPEILSFILNVLHPRPCELTSLSGQIVVSSENLSELVPREYENSEVGLSQFESSALEALNLAKVHLVSSTIINTISRALYWIKKYDNDKIDFDKIPLNDHETYKLLGEGLTNGIPPYNKVSIKSLLRQYKPTRIEELIKIRSMELKIAASSEAVKPEEEDITTRIVECITGYKCAYLKAHYPVSFMTALFENYFRSTKNYTILMREAQNSDLRIMPPDINHSEFSFSREGDSIRTGLMVVRGMGTAAFNEIDKVRKGGSFVDLMDLCRRTDSRLLNFKAIENLIKAGCFDCFKENRSQMLANLQYIIKYSRKKEEQSPSKNGAFELTLFDLNEFAADEEESDEPEITHLDEFSDETLYKHEVASTGHCVTFEPLFPYKDCIEKIRAMSPYDIVPSMEGGIIYTAGFIDHIEREGLYIEYGVEMVLDFEGKVVVIPGDVYKKSSNAIYSSEPVLIGGRIFSRENETYIKAHCVFTLKEVEEQAAKVKVLNIDMTDQSRSTLKKIYKLFKQYPGDTQAEVFGFKGFGQGYVKKINQMGIYFSPPIYYELISLIPKNAFEFIYNE